MVFECPCAGHWTHLCKLAQACSTRPCHLACRYSEVQKAVENNLRKQAQVLRGIDANMRSFGDLLQQSSQATDVSCPY